MQNKRHHILSILLIIFMIIMGVSTPASMPKQKRNSITREIRGEYILFKIKTRMNPNNYCLLPPEYHYGESFTITFDSKEIRQVFEIYESGEAITKLYTFSWEEGWLISEEITMSEENFSSFIEDKYFIIRIRKDLLKFENPKLDYIYLRDNERFYLIEGYKR